ncbi:MAG: competence/damage-inducible protein A, partial [Bacteroides sp.]
MKVFAEIITVGDELLIGQVVDTNSAWMGKQLNQHGIGVKRITSIRDQADEITAAVDAALKEVDIVLVTGGLGPTKDDITKLSLCRYFKTELVFDEAVYQNIKRILAGRIPMNQQNKSMAYVPKNCTVIQNPVGSASISWFDWQGKVLVSMPGVPQEMKAVMEQEVLPRLSQRFDTDYIMHESFTVKNYAESVLAETLEAWEDQLP